MARRSQHSFLKRQKENKRKEKAEEKMARRHDRNRRTQDEEPELEASGEDGEMAREGEPG